MSLPIPINLKTVLSNEQKTGPQTGLLYFPVFHPDAECPAKSMIPMIF
jgi:hypothetical protein